MVLACALLMPRLPAAAAMGGCQDGDLQAKDEASCIKFCNANAPIGMMAVPSVYAGGGPAQRPGRKALAADTKLSPAHHLPACWPLSPAHLRGEASTHIWPGMWGRPSAVVLLPRACCCSHLGGRAPAKPVAGCMHLTCTDTCLRVVACIWLALIWDSAASLTSDNRGMQSLTVPPACVLGAVLPLTEALKWNRGLPPPLPPLQAQGRCPAAAATSK